MMLYSCSCRCSMYDSSNKKHTAATVSSCMIQNRTATIITTISKTNRTIRRISLTVWSTVSLVLYLLLFVYSITNCIWITYAYYIIIPSPIVSLHHHQYRHHQQQLQQRRWLISVYEHNRCTGVRGGYRTQSSSSLSLHTTNQQRVLDTTIAPSSLSQPQATTTTLGSNIIGTDPNTKPNYDTMVGPFGKWIDILCMTLFRNKLRDQVLLQDIDYNDNTTTDKKRIMLTAIDSSYYSNPVTNYTQIVTLAKAMNARYGYSMNGKEIIQTKALNTLIHLFPQWLPKWYTILFAKPFPIFSAQMNAYITAALGVWLMGECTVNDIPIPITVESNNNNIHNSTTMTTTITTDVYNNNIEAHSNINSNNVQIGSTTTTIIGKNQGVLVTRCRFLEESQCASICINSCKIPTQNFFLQQMGIPLVMEPNYMDGSCQFSFGRYPNTTTETIAIRTPCLTRCPTSGSYRPNHYTATPATSPSNDYNYNITQSLCSMIGES